MVPYETKPRRYVPTVSSHIYEQQTLTFLKTLVQLLSPEDVPPSAHAELRKMMQSRGMKPALVEGIMGSLVVPEEGTVPTAGGEQQGPGNVVKVVVSVSVRVRRISADFSGRS